MTQNHTIIFGLTADPIHLGHEQAMINGIQYLQGLNITIEEFILIPVYQPNLIAGKKAPKAHFKQRVKMCHIVASKLSKQLKCQMVVNEIEKDLATTTGQNNFSLNTIIHLNKENCLFMVSADHFQGRWPKFRKWYGWQEILKHSGLLINQRPGHKINKNFIKQLREFNPNIYLVENLKSVNTSSTEIRTSLYSAKNNKVNLNSYLSEDIVRYISEQGLYKADTAG